MKKGGQINKARNHEREVAKLLTEAFYPKGDGEFRRVPLSGGWDKRIAPGDVIPFRKTDQGMTIDFRFPLFPIECKNWRAENVTHLFAGLYSNESVVYAWMEQAINDALQMDGSCMKYPLVVFKLWKENVAMVSHSTYGYLAGYFGHTDLRFYRIEVWQGRGKEEDLHFFLLKDFLEWIDWEHFKL